MGETKKSGTMFVIDAGILVHVAQFAYVSRNERWRVKPASRLQRDRRKGGTTHLTVQSGSTNGNTDVTL